MFFFFLACASFGLDNEEPQPMNGISVSTEVDENDSTENEPTEESNQSEDGGGEDSGIEIEPEEPTDGSPSGDDDVSDDFVEDDEEAVPEPSDTVAPTVLIESPLDGDTVGNPVRFAVVSSDVVSLALYADEWSLGSIPESGVLEYTFSEVDRPRVIRLVGLDASGIAVAEDVITITPTNGEGESAGSLGEVPYFYQYDNIHEPSATCGLTSAAMLLGSLGSGRTPDDLYVAYGKEQGQSPEGLAELYRWEGFTSEFGRTGTRRQMKEKLDDGHAIVTHGFWTDSGHIVVLVDHDDLGWWVHDPAGDWYLGYGTGHGEMVHYPFESAWDDALSVDGDIWWSTAW